jgi:hypothetical protein
MARQFVEVAQEMSRGNASLVRFSPGLAVTSPLIDEVRNSLLPWTPKQRSGLPAPQVKAPHPR